MFLIVLAVSLCSRSFDAAPGPRENCSLSDVICLFSHAGVHWVLNLNHGTYDTAEKSKSVMFRVKLLTHLQTHDNNVI